MQGSEETIDDVAITKMAKGAFIVFMGLMLGYLLEYVIRLLIARWYGPAQYGSLSLGIAIMSILAVFAIFGLEEGVSRQISFYKGQKDKIRGIISFALKTSIIFSIIFAVCLFICAENLSVIFNDPSLYGILQVFAITLPFFVIFKDAVAIIRGLHVVKYKFYFQDIFAPFFRILLLVSFFVLGYGIIGPTLAYSISIITAALILLYVTHTKIIKLVPFAVDKEIRKELIKFSWPLMIMNISSLLSAWTNTIVLGLYKTTTEIGIYNALMPTAMLLQFPFTAFSFLFMPILTEMVAKKQIDGIRNIYSVVTRWVFMVSLPVLVLIFLFPEQIINTLFGSEYVVASLVFIFLAIGNFVPIATGPKGYTIISFGRTKISLLTWVSILLINLGLSLVLIPIYGLVGAALSFMIAMVSVHAIMLVYVNRSYGIWPFSLNYLKSIFACLISAGIIYWLVDVLTFSTTNAIIACIVYFISYVTLILLFRALQKEDYMLIDKFKRKLGLSQ
ncbi:MAG: flippase [Candidatus Aenigmarchaeota archaeon]|nr:flippase [Candidatus Aenigmarchaeota archaeon]